MTKSKVAILLTQGDYSTPLTKEYGDFAQQSAQLLSQAGLQLECQTFNAVASDFPSDNELKNVKAIWITGSTSDSFENDPWILNLIEFIQKVYKNYDIPFVGICFGHQIISRALGATVGRNTKGWELGVYEVNISDNQEIRELFQGAEQFQILEVHQDIVFSAPEGCTSIGCSKSTKLQGLYRKGKLLTFQGHPEFQSNMVQEVVKDLHQRGKISDDIRDYSFNTLAKQHQGLDIGKLIVRFIQS